LISNELVISQEGTVHVTAIKLQGKPIAICCTKLQAIPVAKFSSWLMEAVVRATNNDTEWQEEYLPAMN
jgi:hypothetical protein